ncbi:MAG: ATP-binding protein [Candidatus Avoscillospira sp.]
MAYSEQVLRRAKARLAQAKEECEAESAARTEEIYTQYPRLREIDRAMRQSVAKAVAAAFRKGEDPTAAIEAIKQENLALQQEREWILEAADLDETALEPTVVCPRCGGSGYVGASMCECLRELCRQEQKKELSSLLSGNEHFGQFRLDYYPTEPDPVLGVSPRQLMQNTYTRCRQYAREFSLKSPSLLFSGGPGLGKTFLSACIARTVADNGFSVVYDTAGKLFSDFEAVKFGSGTGDLTKKYLSCDLLIIDDLGTEMTTQFTQSVLYQVVNTRLMDGKPVIISTNLDDKGLRQRYAAPIASRLLGSYETCMFLGRDIRQIRR